MIKKIWGIIKDISALIGIFGVLITILQIYLGVNATKAVLNTSAVILVSFLLLLFIKLFFDRKVEEVIQKINEHESVRDQKRDVLIKKTLSEYKEDVENSITNLKERQTTALKDILAQANHLLPEQVTSLTFDSLKYIEKNQKRLYTEKCLDSEYVKSFIHLNTSYYAATVFLYKEASGTEQAKLLFAKDFSDDVPSEKNMKPLGGRLPKNGLPEKYLEKIIRYNTGFLGKSYNYCTFKGHEIAYKGMIDDQTKVMKCPITIQLESNIQKDGVPYHLDFIYLVKVKNHINSSLRRNGNLDPDWYSISEVEDAMDKDLFVYESTKRLAKLIINRYKENEIIPQE